MKRMMWESLHLLIPRLTWKGSWEEEDVKAVTDEFDASSSASGTHIAENDSFLL